MNLGLLSLGWFAVRASVAGTTGGATSDTAMHRHQAARVVTPQRPLITDGNQPSTDAGKRTRRADLLGSLLFGLCALATLAGCIVHLGRLLAHWPWLFDLVRSLVG